MQEFANRLVAQARGLPLEAANSAIEGLNALITRESSPLRIGMWPLVSTPAPETAMGLMTVLGFLLERWQDIAAYRLFVRIEGDPAQYRWKLNDSQFDVDEWQLDVLDENIGMWGTLDKNNGWILEIQLENDDAEASEDAFSRAWQAKTLAEMVNHLPEIASEIADNLGATTTRPIAPLYEPTNAAEGVLETLLKQVFHWERRLSLSLWGIEWPEQEIRSDMETLLDSAVHSGDFGAWAAAQSLGRAMLPTTREIGEHLIPVARDAVKPFSASASFASLVALALFNLDQEQDAYDVLEASIEVIPDSPLIRLTLAMLYQQGRHISEMIDTLQEAIDEAVTNTDLLMLYGALIVSLRQNGVVVPRFVFADELARQLEGMLAEAIATYTAVLEADDAHTRALQRRIVLLSETDDLEMLWSDFARLVELDENGDIVRSVLDALQTLGNFDDAVDILSAASEAQPDRADLLVNLAAALILNGQEEEAVEPLEAAAELTNDMAVLADIEHMLLIANDPEFEMRLGDITDLLGANKAPSQRDIDFLENALENAPSFAEGYLLLARGYVARNDDAAMLETLLDGQKALPEEPTITEQLARVLWEAGERDLAFDYLYKGLGYNPDHVPLLALAGQYLFDDGQEEEARTFLTRAEILNPRDRVLREVQRHIARKIDD